VSPSTVEKVLEVAASLRYERNDLAASLRQGTRSHTLGLVIEDLANRFYSAIAQAVEESARARDSLLITGSAREDPSRERELVGRCCAGASMPPDRPRGARSPVCGGLRFESRAVFLDRPRRRPEPTPFLTDKRGGSRRAVAHLLGTAHPGGVFVATICASTPLGDGLAG